MLPESRHWTMPASHRQIQLWKELCQLRRRTRERWPSRRIREAARPVFSEEKFDRLEPVFLQPTTKTPKQTLPAPHPKSWVAVKTLRELLSMRFVQKAGSFFTEEKSPYPVSMPRVYGGCVFEDRAYPKIKEINSKRRQCKRTSQAAPCLVMAVASSKAFDRARIAWRRK